MSYFSFFTAKLLVSFGVFLVSLITSERRSLQKLTYHLGFPSDRWHAGMSCGDKFFHYAFPRGDAKEKDQSWGLTPCEAPKKIGDVAHVKAKCGYAFAGATDAGVLKVLESCGRCHNWALITIYEMSTDKFLSLSMLSFLRWDVWVLLVGLTVAVPMLCFPNGSFSDVAGPVFDVLFLALSLFDGWNMNTDRLLANRRYAFGFLNFKNALKLVVLFAVWYVYVAIVIARFSVTCSFQFILLLVLSVIISGIVHLIIA